MHQFLNSIPHRGIDADEVARRRNVDEKWITDNPARGDALVSEGLAVHFVRRVFPGAPQWEHGFDNRAIAANFPDAAALMSAKYSYAEWFAGAGRYRCGLGHAMGSRIVGAWISKTGNVDVAMMINIDSKTVLAVGAADIETQLRPRCGSSVMHIHRR